MGIVHQMARARAEAKPKRVKRGPKALVSLRLDQDVVDALKASGPGWQTRANEVLRKSVGLAV